MANKEQDFFTKVVHPYGEIHDSIEIYKDSVNALLEVFEKFYLLQSISKIRDQARYLKITIEQLDEIDTNNYSLYLSYIEPQLDGLMMDLENRRLDILFNRDSEAIDKLMEALEYLRRIELQTFI